MCYRAGLFNVLDSVATEEIILEVASHMSQFESRQHLLNIVNCTVGGELHVLRL